MRVRERYTPTSDPKGAVYRKLIAIACSECASAYLIVTPSLGTDEMMNACLHDLEPHKVSEDQVREWPGTVLGEGLALQLTYRASDMLTSVLLKHSDAFGHWLQPSRPEDLGFLRKDGSLWVGSIAHNSDVFFDLSIAELADIGRRLPQLELLRDLAFE